jgi:hypothetical protein
MSHTNLRQQCAGPVEGRKPILDHGRHRQTMPQAAWRRQSAGGDRALARLKSFVEK